MPIGSVAIWLVIAVLSFAEYRSRAASEWRSLGVGALVGVATLVLVRGGILTSTLFSRQYLWDVVAAFGAMVLAVDLIGLPLPVARRLRLGLHSREWEFHRRLYALTEKARSAAQEAGEDRGSEPDRIPDIVARMRRLRAPTQEWAELRDRWVSLWDRYIVLRSEPAEASGQAYEDYLALNRDLIEETARLAARYRADASRIRGKRS